MKNSLRNMSLALALMVSAAPLLTVHADAKASFMAECSAKFKAAKAANTLGADTKWTDFMKHQCAADASAAAPATPAVAAAPAAPADAMVKPAKKKKMKAADAPVAQDAMATKTPSGSFMQNCSASWKSMKAAGTVPAGMAWKDFIAAKCVVDGAAAPAATPVTAAAKPAKKKPAVVMQDETPAEPATATDAGPVKTMDKNGKPFTPGQMAAHARARACGAKWRGEKAAGTLQVGLKWPQYWSACNTEMKAAGQ
jgi:hypothetical protein